MLDPSPLWAWANERHSVYLRKTLLEGSPIPAWAAPSRPIGVKADFSLDHLTNDPILKSYRFCNVFRELDRVTVWIRENIREPFADHENLWLMLAIARTINWPPTLQFIMNRHAQKCRWAAWPSHDEGLGPHSFSPENLGAALDWWSGWGQKVYTGAYMIRAESDRSKSWYDWSKQRYIAEIVIGRLWEDRSAWRGFLEPNEGPVTLQEVWKYFQQPRYIGWGPFMAGQVVTDLRHTRYLRNAPDLDRWTALGPGSRRGLNRLLGRDPATPLSQDAALMLMLQIHAEQDKYRGPHVPRIELSDIQNCLCETDKYLRVKNGEGRPRAMYVRGRGY